MPLKDKHQLLVTSSALKILETVAGYKACEVKQLEEKPGFNLVGHIMFGDTPTAVICGVDQCHQLDESKHLYCLKLTSSTMFTGEIYAEDRLLEKL